MSSITMVWVSFLQLKKRMREVRREKRENEPSRVDAGVDVGLSIGLNDFRWMSIEWLRRREASFGSLTENCRHLRWDVEWRVTHKYLYLLRDCWPRTRERKSTKHVLCLYRSIVTIETSSPSRHVTWLILDHMSHLCLFFRVLFILSQENLSFALGKAKSVESPLW